MTEENGRTALISAAHECNDSDVEKLLVAIEKDGILKEQLEAKDKDGQTALIVAAEGCETAYTAQYKGIVEELLVASEEAGLMKYHME